MSNTKFFGLLAVVSAVALSSVAGCGLDEPAPTDDIALRWQQDHTIGDVDRAVMAWRSAEASGTAHFFGDGFFEALIRAIAHAQGLEGSPKLDQPDLDDAQRAVLRKRADLGRFLFHDKALSGPNHTSCATCHHPAFFGADGQNIARGVFCEKSWTGPKDAWGGDDLIYCQDPGPDGEGGNVVGPHRTAPLNERNSPTIINAPLFPKQMLDGRFHFVDNSSNDVNELNPNLGFNVQPPEGVLFTRSLLGAQAFKPVPSPIEMAGNFLFEGQPLPPPDVHALAVQTAIAERIDGYETYHDLFEAAYPADVQVYPADFVVTEDTDIEFFMIGDAIATWQEQDLVMTDSPWDAFLAGDNDAISDAAKRGAFVFFTYGRCSSCHSGDLFTDFENYNLGVPQIGPGTGKSDPDPAYAGETDWDFGAEQTTGNRADRFKFRTPPLRGVALTAPYMHNGAYATLEDAIRHHVWPGFYYQTYDMSQLHPDVAAFGKNPAGPVFDEQNPVAVAAGAEHDIIWLTDQNVADLVELMKAFTDPRMIDFQNAAPEELPSGIPADVPGPRVYPVYE